MDETKKRIVELETKIEKACSEENFDLAGMHTLLNLLTITIDKLS